MWPRTFPGGLVQQRCLADARLRPVPRAPGSPPREPIRRPRRAGPGRLPRRRGAGRLPRHPAAAELLSDAVDLTPPAGNGCGSATPCCSPATRTPGHGSFGGLVLVSSIAEPGVVRRPRFMAFGGQPACHLGRDAMIDHEPHRLPGDARPQRDGHVPFSEPRVVSTILSADHPAAWSRRTAAGTRVPANTSTEPTRPRRRSTRPG